jgi:hypothetical protein
VRVVSDDRQLDLDPGHRRVVFLGDAAGWSNPVDRPGSRRRVARRRSSPTSSWARRGPATRRAYADERAERMRRLRFARR